MKPDRNQVFIGYAHEDSHWKDLFASMFAPAVARGTISLWSDDSLSVGGDWSNIEQAIDSSRAVVLLVTPHLLASHFFYQVELPRLLSMATTAGAAIRWVPISASVSHETPLVNFQAAWDPARPLDQLTAPERNAAVQQICAQIVDELGFVVATHESTAPHHDELTPRAQKRNSPRVRKTKPRRRIFLCYRREDSGVIVGRIFDRLVKDFGKENIFKDVDNIPFGVDFVEYLDREVQKCEVLFAVIGPRWLEAAADGASRLEDKNDFVRIEVASALRRSIPVVPILVDGAVMPRVQQLPTEIQALAHRNSAPVRHDPDFHSDMTRLLSRLP